MHPAGCITRDPRVVERKKEGQRKARAKYTWYVPKTKKPCYVKLSLTH